MCACVCICVFYVCVCVSVCLLVCVVCFLKLKVYHEHFLKIFVLVFLGLTSSFDFLHCFSKIRDFCHPDQIITKKIAL